MTVILYQFPPNDGDFRASAPCVAVEAYLRLAGIAYRCVTERPLKGSNTNVLPAVCVDGKTISDSENIIRYFESREGDALDSFLNQTQQAEKLMLWRLMNGSIYQFMVAERWLHPEVYPRFVETFRKMLLPGPLEFIWPMLRPLVARRVRGKYLRSIAHLTPDQMQQFMSENFSVLSQRLGEQTFLFGDAPSSADAYLFAYIYAFLATPFDSPTKRLIRDRHANLVAFYERLAPRLVGEIP